MSDSIDRQKVLNTLDFADNALTDEERTVEKYKELLTECIKVLPSSENDGDLISRQAVINAIANTIVNGESLGYGLAEEIVSEITSVENKGEWIPQPSNKEQGERDFIWWKCSKCGQVIYSETEKDREEFHAFCGRCGADMRGNDDE